MEKRAIGFKIEYNVATIVLMVIAGAVLITLGLFVFLFFIAGAIGGAILGGCAGGGAMFIYIAVYSSILPKELVFIDENTLYLHKKEIKLSAIREVTYRGKNLLIKPTEGKGIAQGLIKNCKDCCDEITNAILKQNQSMQNK